MLFCEMLLGRVVLICMQSGKSEGFGHSSSPSGWLGSPLGLRVFPLESTTIQSFGSLLFMTVSKSLLQLMLYLISVRCNCFVHGFCLTGEFAWWICLVLLLDRRCLGVRVSWCGGGGGG